MLRTFVGSIGVTGVDLFFVLSGYLITGILLRNKGTEHYFRDFYIRRAQRILPLYFAFLLTYLLITYPRFVAPVTSDIKLLAYPFFL